MYLFSFIPIPTFIMSSEIYHYIDSQSSIRKERLLSLRTWLIDTFPGIQESMKYKMPTYQLDENWISFASQKNHISIYLCRPDSLKELKKKFPTLLFGKACLNVRDKDSFPLKVIQSSIRSALKPKAKLRIPNEKAESRRKSISKKLFETKSAYRKK
ncbi:hypothetical protein A0128_03145 [Leptospira tipperaryensis]|uniref:YdhG-like domain-containing protein n=2 Tax=Leptospira tipperaryensis TaxID=2564040 RepID=A0A1D7UTK5_9LEPT|nr:hypothetical protein A0128_03145 [Leptospira tipperaryensis]